ncbi:unnamed protein product [Prorocentrum cordatum]|uniref:Uncharacterized protein n=1 Tax=Prorocentrum cordatum TaxID=2364126 RepID=A0ABN9YGX8_9DINO|nr:unnamed protein product [Polarella glacialis]
MTKTSRSNVLERRISGEQVAPPALAKNEAGPGRPPGLGCRWAPATNTHDGRADRTLGRVTRDRELTGGGGGGGGGGGEGVGLCHAARLRKTSSKDNRRCASAPRLCQAEAAVAVAASLLDWPGRRQKRRRGSSSGRSSRSRRKRRKLRKIRTGSKGERERSAQLALRHSGEGEFATSRCRSDPHLRLPNWK